MAQPPSFAKGVRGRAGTVYIFGPTESINDFYNFHENLGQPGQFGRAVRATKKDPEPDDPENFAVKIIQKARFSRSARSMKRVFATFRTEVEIMARLKHPNIIRFKECFEDKTHFYIVMEMCSGGELFDRITAKGQYTEQDAARVLRQLFEGLDYLHKNKIAHCDLKPDNFIFANKDETAPVKIIDFGMSKLVEPRRYFEKFCGTPYYVAPEVLDGRYNEACDIWSMGVVCFVMLHGYPPFHADPAKYGAAADSKVYSLIRQGFKPIVKKGYKNHFPKTIPISAGARDFIAKLLESDTSKRLTAEEALDHPWLQGKTASNVPIDQSIVKSLKSFSSINRFQQGLLEVLSAELSQAEMDKLKETFEAMDENKDGTISIAELEKALADQDLETDEIKAIMDNADVDGDGTISYDELLLTYVKKKICSKEERLFDAFCKLDKNGDGKITVDELKSALGHEDEELAKELLKEADHDGNGVIDYDEFMNLWTDAPVNKPPPPQVRIHVGSSISVSNLGQLGLNKDEVDELQAVAEKEDQKDSAAPDDAADK